MMRSESNLTLKRKRRFKLFIFLVTSAVLVFLLRRVSHLQGEIAELEEREKQSLQRIEKLERIEQSLITVESHISQLQGVVQVLSADQKSSAQRTTTADKSKSRTTKKPAKP